MYRKRINKSRTFTCLIFLIGIICLPACKTYRPVSMPATLPLPANYGINHNGDTTNMAAFSWRVFFKDPLLVALIDSALRNNADLLIAAERIEIARAFFQKTRAATQPVLNAAGSAGLDKFGEYTMNGVGNYDTNLSPNISKDQKIPTHPTPDYFIGVRSTWEIDFWGKLKHRKKAAAARLLATESGRRWMVTTLVSELAIRYYTLLVLDNEQRIIQRNTKYQETALEIVEAQKEGGRATELAVQQFRAQLYHTRSFAYQISQSIIETEAGINFLIGRYQQPVVRDSSALLQIVQQPVQTGIPSALLANRPDIREAEQLLQGAGEDLAAARAAYLPSFTISSYAGLNAFAGSLLLKGASLTYGLLGGITAPLFNRGEIKTGYSIAVAENRQAVYQYQKLLVNGLNEVITQVNQVNNYTQFTVLKKQEVNELSLAVSSANDLYITGYASYLEVITAQKAVLEAEIELNNSQKEIALGIIGLYKALGGGWQ